MKSGDNYGRNPSKLKIHLVESEIQIELDEREIVLLDALYYNILKFDNKF